MKDSFSPGVRFLSLQLFSILSLLLLQTLGIQKLFQSIGVTMTSSETKSYQSPENLQHHLLWQYENNRSITTNWHYFFLIAYIFVGIVALMANGLVVLAVYRNKKVRFKITQNTRAERILSQKNWDARRMQQFQECNMGMHLFLHN